MPKAAHERSKPIEEYLEAWIAFQTAFKRSRKGNLWCKYDGAILTVFRRQDDQFGWSIAEAEGIQFSPGAFESEDDAMCVLWDAVRCSR